MTLLINLWGGLMALLFPKPERRKNRGSDTPPDKYVRQYARLHKTLAAIANMTKKEMPDDDEFRRWAQDEAHFAIENARQIP